MATVLPAPRWRALLTGGTSLVAATIVASNVLRIASTLVLTRALSPADFGVTGMTSAILVVMLMISDLGFGVYLISHAKGDDPRLLDIVWTVRLVRSLALTLILAAASGPLAMLLAKPEMQAVIAVSALQFIVEGASALTPFTAVREKQLGRLALLDIVSAVIQTALGIALAVWLRTYWGIVFAGLLATAAKSVLTYTMFPGSARRLAFDREEVAKLWQFGRTIASAHTIQVLLSNADKFVLSRIFPLGAFGLYTLASNLSGAPSAFTSLYPSRVLLPDYAEAVRRREPDLAGVYYGRRRPVMLLYLVAMGGFIGMAPAVIDLLYDPRYADAQLYLRMLSLVPALALNNYAAREMLISLGRVKTLFYANLVRLGWLGAMGTGFYLLWGPLGLVAAVGLIEAPVTLYCWFELRRDGVLRWSEELAMLATLGIGVVLGLACNQAWFRIAAALA